MFGVIYWRNSGVQKLINNKQIGFVDRKNKYTCLSWHMDVLPNNITNLMFM
jgi:hypothetical protein